MNPRLIKFTLELQSQDAPENKPKYISFKGGKGEKDFFKLVKAVYVTVPVDKQ